MRLNIAIITAATILFASCEKEIKVTLPEHTPALTLNSYTETNDTIRLQVGHSISILKYKNSSDFIITNATVALYKDGSLAETIHYDPVLQEYKSNTIAEPGKSYTVKVSATGYNAAEATAGVPSVIPITGIQHFSNVRTDMDGQSLDEVRIKFTDPATAGDFYIIRVVQGMDFDTTGHSYQSSTCINSTDPSIENVSNEDIGINTCLSSNNIFIRDDLFNGQIKELSLYIPSGFISPFSTEPGGPMIYSHIELYHVSEAYFRYLKTYQFASENNGNPFAEPANIYTNVKNGYGNFSIVSYDSKEIQ